MLNVGVAEGPLGETLIDAGAAQRGGVSAGLRIAEICMGGLGQVSLAPNAATPRWPWTISVASSQPVIACLGSQYAGWNLSHGTGRARFSRSDRVRRERSPRKRRSSKTSATGTHRIALRSSSKATARRRPRSSKRSLATAGVAPSAVTVIYAPTQSLAGGAQVAARVLEVALHKAHETGVPARADRRRDGRRAAVAAAPGFRDCNGPHQRRHHIRRRWCSSS